MASTYDRLVNPKFQAFDSDGVPLVGGLLYTYTAGTTTNKATYSTPAGTANANPVVMDSRGEADVYGSGFYKFVLKTSAGVTVWTLDNVLLFTDKGMALLDDATVAAQLTSLGFTTLTSSLVDDATMGAFLTSLGISAPVQTLLDDATIAAMRVTLGVGQLGFSSPTAGRAYTTGDDTVVFVPGEISMENAAGTRTVLTMPTAITKTVTGKTASTQSYFYLGIPSSGTTIAAGDITANETKPTDKTQRGLMDSAGNLKYLGSALVDSASDFVKSYIAADGFVVLDEGQDVGSKQLNGFTNVDVSAYCPSVDNTLVKFTALTGVNSSVITRKDGSAGAGISWVTANDIGVDVVCYEAMINAVGVFEMNTTNIANTKNIITGWLEPR